jgi:hypothetical protein
VNKDGEIIINSIKIIKTIYKSYCKINVSESPEVAHGILGFRGTRFENRWKSDTEENKLLSTGVQKGPVKHSGHTGPIPPNAEHGTSCG